MARKLLLINLILVLLVAALGLQLVWSWQSFEQERNIGRIMAEFRAAPNEGAQPIDAGNHNAYLDYQLISEKNLFSPDRQPPQEEGEEAAEMAPPPLVPEPILHGTLKIADVQFATVTKFEGTGRRRTQGTKVRVGLGDVVQGYTVSEISRDAMVLKWNDTEVVIEKELNARPENAPRAIARGGGVNIIRIGAPVTAVETTTPTTEDETQQEGLTVSRTGPAQSTRGGTSGLAGRGQPGSSGRGAGATDRLRNSRGRQSSNPNLRGNRQGTLPTGSVPPGGRPPR